MTPHGQDQGRNLVPCLFLSTRLVRSVTKNGRGEQWIWYCAHILLPLFLRPRVFLGDSGWTTASQVELPLFSPTEFASTSEKAIFI
jgi:hypothetical protein